MIRVAWLAFLLSACQQVSDFGFRSADRAVQNGFIITLFVYHF